MKCRGPKVKKFSFSIFFFYIQNSVWEREFCVSFILLFLNKTFRLFIYLLFIIILRNDIILSFPKSTPFHRLKIFFFFLEDYPSLEDPEFAMGKS